MSDQTRYSIIIAIVIILFTIGISWVLYTKMEVSIEDYQRVSEMQEEFPDLRPFVRKCFENRNRIDGFEYMMIEQEYEAYVARQTLGIDK